MPVLPAWFGGLVFFVLTILPGRALAEPYPTSRPRGTTTEIEFALALLDISSIDTASQSFTADIAMVLRWSDARLALPGSELRTLDRTEVWSPEVSIVNQRDVTSHLPELVDVSADGTVVYRQRFTGTFSNRINVADFPFDEHDFRVQFMLPAHGTGDVRFVNGALRDRTGVEQNPLVVDWDVRSWRVDSKPYTTKLTSYARPGFAIEFHAVRRSGFFVMKLLFPLALVVFMSWAVFWLNPERIDAQVGMAATAVLTVITYRFAFDSLLPRVSYLTRVDYFISGSTALVFLSLLQVVVTGSLMARNRTPQAHKLDRWSRVAFPAAFAVLTWWSLVA
jgi:hypothetical protein